MSATKLATFTALDPYKLTGVSVTARELGHGSYATVLELDYMGLKCAGKKIHELLLELDGSTRYIVHKFEEECHLLSQVHHPNIVQFLGVYFQEGVRVPILVMEFLPTNLTFCIEQYGILPKEISYSILNDVALGLCYLHSQSPSIIHRDLSSNNVLLTPNMTAKISDLGVARILNLTPLQISRMTQAPGTPAYMPPEVMVANPKYDASVDVFSYGIMMIHVFSGRWPEPQVGPNRTEPSGKLIPVTEAERREVFLRAIDHPLMDLILKCINNHPQTRANANEIVKRLAKMVLQFPTSFANRLQMLKQIEAITKENRDLKEEGRRIEALDKENRDLMKKSNDLQKENGDLQKQNSTLMEEIKRINSEMQELSTKYEMLKIEYEAADRGLTLRDLSFSQVGITWKRCTRLPTRINNVKIAIVNSKVYCGGGITDDSCRDDEYIVYCYNPSQDKWTTLPQLPVYYFGLGQVNGELVAVGGRTTKSEDYTRVTSTNSVHTYDESSRKWKQTIPPMPTARDCINVLSLQSALVVAGGCTSPFYTAAVEIFKTDTSQWYRTDPLPTVCANTSLVAIGNTCYALGGYNGSLLNRALYTSIDDLFDNAVPANQTIPSGSSHTQLAWKTLPNTPTYRPAAAVLAGNLLAIGGKETSSLQGASKKEVHMYSPSTNSWIYISDLPDPLAGTVVAVLSSIEILVIGGLTAAGLFGGLIATGGTAGDRVNTVYRGTLHLEHHCENVQICANM